jgi:hypothetical protein
LSRATRAESSAISVHDRERTVIWKKSYKFFRDKERVTGKIREFVMSVSRTWVLKIREEAYLVNLLEGIKSTGTAPALHDSPRILQYR